MVLYLSSHRICWLWFTFGIPVFMAVAAILWLMIAKP
ncbi:putative membrane protein [Bradyrhizobium elkanii]|nr:putative membrane protein [Bradyrhizobium elkanii]